MVRRALLLGIGVAALHGCAALLDYPRPDDGDGAERCHDDPNQHDLGRATTRGVFP